MDDLPEGFTQRDRENLQRVKDAMADKSAGQEGVLGSGPDVAAAGAYAALLDAETRRQELALSTPGKDGELHAPEVTTAPRIEDSPWAEKVLSKEGKPNVAAALGN